VTQVIRHPDGVLVNGRLYERDAFYAAEHTSVQEWVAFVVLVVGLGLWAAVCFAGLAALAYFVIRALKG